MNTTIDNTHPIDILTIPMPWQAERGVGVNIKPELWIASYGVVTYGVSFEEGNVIAVCAVVARDGTSDAVVGGVSARKIRSRQYATPNASPSANGLKQEPAAS